MRRKKAARKAGPSKPLSAHEDGKISPRESKAPASGQKSVKYDDESIYKPAEPLTVREEEILSFVADDQSNDASPSARKFPRAPSRNTSKTFSKKFR